MVLIRTHGNHKKLEFYNPLRVNSNLIHFQMNIIYVYDYENFLLNLISFISFFIYRNGKNFWIVHFQSSFHRFLMNYWKQMQEVTAVMKVNWLIGDLWWYFEVPCSWHYSIFCFYMILEENERFILDVGCGPSISNIISASKWSQNIIMADYLESNRREVERFWKVCNVFIWLFLLTQLLFNFL